MAGIQDVAREAGVSISTVSRVLNQVGGVSGDKVERVMFAVEKLGYRPNVLARSLVQRKTNTLGLLIPDIENPTFNAVARGAEDEAYRRGFTLFLCNSDGLRGKESQYIEGLLQKQVDGVLITSIGGETDSVRTLAESVPVVQVGRLVDPAVPAVVADNRLGGRLVCQHLLDLGHRRLAFISGPSEVPTSQERLRGALGFLEAKGIQPATVVHTTYAFQSGLAATAQVLKERSGVTAIVAGNDLIALGAMAAAKAAAVRVPEELSIIGYDNIPTAALITPGLTTVSLRYHRMGAVAAGLLIDLINGKRRPTNITLGVRLAVRDSTGPTFC